MYREIWQYHFHDFFQFHSGKNQDFHSEKFHHFSEYLCSSVYNPESSYAFREVLHNKYAQDLAGDPLSQGVCLSAPGSAQLHT